MPQDETSDYLSDGAYVRRDPLDPTTIWIEAMRDGMQHRVALDVSGYRALKRFAGNIWPNVETGR